MKRKKGERGNKQETRSGAVRVGISQKKADVALSHALPSPLGRKKVPSLFRVIVGT